MDRPSRWKRLTIGVLVTAVTLSVGVAVLFEMARRVPPFYEAAERLTYEDCSSDSRQFVRQSTAIFNQIENEPSWSGLFRQQHVNAWLAWDFARKHREVLPHGVSNPRISFSAGRATIAFRMQNGPVEAVISACGRVWLPEPNFVAIELESVRAGAIPVPPGVVVQTVTDAVRAAGFEIEWRRHDGNPVALVRLGRADNPGSARVEQVELRDGLLYVAGRSPGGGSRKGDSPGRVSDVRTKRHAPDSSSRR
jgi:hypothetical protein